MSKINHNELSLIEQTIPNVDLIKLKNIYEDNKNQFIRSIKSCHPKLYNHILTYPGINIQEKIYRIFNEKNETFTCLTCNKPLIFKSTQRGFGKYCSTKCCINSETMIEKSKQTCIKKYGVDHSSKNPESILKRQKTNLQRYGHINNLHSFEMQKYRKQKIKENWINIKNKTEQTNLKKYGVKYQTLRKDFIKSTQKIHDDLYYLKYFVPRINYLKNKGFELITEIKSKEKDFLQKNKIFKHSKCNNIFDFDPRKLEICPKCKFISKPEQELFEFISSFYNKEIIRNDRTLISPYEIDLFLPELKLCFEMNGVYWHGSNSSSSLLTKTNNISKLGLELIHIWDLEWYYDQDKIKSFILNKLNKNFKIYARQCIIKEITSQEAMIFLSKNHRQNYINSKVRLGLFLKDDLISVMTISEPRFNKKYEWEITRYCTKLNINVIGGFTKMLNHFEKLFNPTSLLSYADRRFSSGKMYEKGDFKLTHITKPNYFYWKNNKIVTRYEAQTKNLINILGEKFSIDKTEYQNMIDNGYRKCEDSGNLVYVKKY